MLKSFLSGLKQLRKINYYLSKIVSIWKCNQGVIIFQLDCAATVYEALSREFAMINAISIAKLKNIKNSTYYREMRLWPDMKVKNYGDMLVFQL